MGIFKRSSNDGPKDPRDTIGQNPTGRARKSSAGKRRQAQGRMERDLEGTEWEDDESEGEY